MLLLGHTGITLGVTVAISHILARRLLPTMEGESQKHTETQSIAPPDTQRRIPAWLKFLHRYVDLRLLLIGSLVPDIIDKPVGMYFFRDTFSNGRIFAHTFVFILVIAVAGLWVLGKYHKSGILVIAFGTFTHLAFDRMWQNPATLFWPLYGFAFRHENLTFWVEERFLSLYTVPKVYIPEIIGAAVLIWFTVEMIRHKRLRAFLMNSYK